MITRRSLITGLATFNTAPAIVRASSLMPVKAWPSPVITDLGGGPFAHDAGDWDVSQMPIHRSGYEIIDLDEYHYEANLPTTHPNWVPRGWRRLRGLDGTDFADLNGKLVRKYEANFIRARLNEKGPATPASAGPS